MSYVRPTTKDLALARELGRGRFATALAVNGHAVKRITGAAATQEMRLVREGTRRLQNAGVAVLPIIDQWAEGNSVYYVQPLAPPPETWTDERVEQGIKLADAAFQAGVTDVLPHNVGLDGDDNLVVIDPGELCDPEDEDDQMYQGDVLWNWGIVMDD